MQSDPDTPTRASRVEEKAELRELNKRLEYYILLQRERDAEVEGYLRQIAELKEHHQQELDDQRKQVTIELKKETETCEKLRALNTKLEEENGRQTTLVKQLQSEIQNQRTLRSFAEEKNDKLSSELQTAKIQAAEAEERARISRENLDEVLHDNKLLEGEVSRLQSELGESTAAIASLKGQVALLTARHHHSPAEAKELESVRAELNSEKLAKSELEEHIRREFGQQLKQILVVRQQQFDEEKDRLLNEFRTELDAQTRGLTGQLEESRQYILELKSSLARLQTIQQNPPPTAAAEKRISELEERVRRAEDALHAEQSRHSRELDQLTAQTQSEIALTTTKIAELQTSLSEKNAELEKEAVKYRDLFDVKIALDMEIKAYRLLLESEEDRIRSSPLHGVPRRPSGPSPAASPTQRHAVPPSESSVSKRQKIKPVGFVVEGEWETGIIHLVNGSGSEVRLDHAQLRNKANHTFTLPNVKLLPGSSLSVYTRVAGAPDGALVWGPNTDQPTIDPNGDKVELVDSLGVVQASAAFQPMP